MMTNKTLIIKSLRRLPQSGPDDELIFAPGVNVIVGRPNTGKTKWLRMLDYLMGEIDPPEDSFGDELVAKYDSVQAVFQIAEEELVIERRWNEKGSKSKVFINGNGISASDFSNVILGKLDIPVLNFPKGNPYAERTWPEISWRMMLRHVYRQERFWGELVDKQPESEQHACLLQFLGLATKIFPQQLGKVVEKRKNLFILKARKEEFQSIFQRFSQELVADDAISVFPTNESIDLRIEALQTEIRSIEEKKEQFLINLVAEKEAKSGNKAADIRLGENRVRLVAEKGEAARDLRKAQQRRQELHIYYKAVQSELERIKRTQVAGQVLCDIKATHCPVCDREVTPRDGANCYLCGQHYDDNLETEVSINSRIEFEVEQMSEEVKELERLLEKIDEEEVGLAEKLQHIDQEIFHIEDLLRPIRGAISAVIYPEISLFDTEMGRVAEKVQQLRRLKNALELRAKLSKDIADLEREIDLLESDLEKIGDAIPLQESNDMLSDGMNTYLNALRSEDQDRWPEDDVRVQLRERGFSISVGNSKWSAKLGATLKCYFLIAYHYSLLSLTNREGCRYPGLCIIDFPPTLTDGSKIADKENFLIEPFIKYVKKEPANIQIIVAGSSFSELQDVHRIVLSKVYK